jgi:hypothetical protein
MELWREQSSSRYKILFDGGACGLLAGLAIELEMDEVLWMVLQLGVRLADKQVESMTGTQNISNSQCKFE